MTMTDPIADMLTRIRNAAMVKKADVLVPYSKIKFAIAKILEKEKYIQGVETVENNFKYLKLNLRYEDKKSPITKLRRVSKSGRRVYVSKEDLPRVLNGYGFAIISTSKGLMTNNEAKHVGLGGEVICEVY
jgi:small subunit ribosomal protein S8